MSSTPLPQSGTPFKRYLNAVRTQRASAPPPVDPFFDDVFLLTPLSGSGQDFVDYSPESANNILTIQNGIAGPLGVYEQNNAVPLFGSVNTLRCERQTTQAGSLAYFTNSGYSILSTDDVCSEIWFNCDVFSSTQAYYLWLLLQNSPGTYTQVFHEIRQFNSTRARAIGSGLPRVNIDGPLSTWYYVAIQTISGTGLAYVSANGVSLGTTPSLGLSRTGFRCYLPHFSSLALGSSGKFAGGQLRLTKANRYGTSAAPVPTAPWPTMGP